MPDDNITITTPSVDFDTIQIDSSKFVSTVLSGYNTGNQGTLTSSTGGNSAIKGNSFNYGNNYANYTFSTVGSSSYTNKSLLVTGDAEFEGDVKIKGVSITDAIEKINQRLAILVPDPAKLEHFEALKKAYNAYKTLEALCELPTKDE